MADERLADLRAAAEACLGGRLAAIEEFRGELTLEAAPSDMPAALAALRDDPELQMTTLVDLCGVDYPSRVPRFDIVYHLLSMRQVARLRLRTKIGEGEPMPSAVKVHPSANWFEREVFDMYGVEFEGHPDLRRILTDYGFEGHPLRKDFPLTGFVEVRYDETRQRVAYEPVRLTQAYRSFEFLSPWEGAAASREALEREGGEER